MARMFQQVLYELGIKENMSSTFHPESQGHSRGFIKLSKHAECILMGLLFAVQESVEEALGFSPFKLLYGREVYGSL